MSMASQPRVEPPRNFYHAPTGDLVLIAAKKRSRISRPLAEALREAVQSTPILHSRVRAICTPIGAAVLTSIFRGSHLAWDFALYTVISAAFLYAVELTWRV